MSTPAIVGARRLPLLGDARISIDVQAIATWLLPFALVVILAFQGGGYDPLIRGQVGIAAWWIVIVGVALGVVPLRHSRLGWAALALLGAFFVWSLIGLSWTESSERTVGEASRLATYLAFLVLALGAQGRAGARHAINGVAAGIALVAALAILHRAKPDWFADEQLNDFFQDTQSRLSFPLHYWNLVATLIVMGIPPLLAAATAARRTALRGLAAATIPVLVLAVYLTVSRSGVVAVGAVVVLFVLLMPDRLPRIPIIGVIAAGSALLCIAADRRDAFQHNLRNAAHQQEGNEMLLLIVLVGLGVALLVAAIALADRHARKPEWARVARGPATSATGLATAALVIAFVAAGGPGWAGDRWDDFQGVNTASTEVDDAFGRLASVTGNGRYDYWKSAERAAELRPLGGIGPGTFEFYWARDGTDKGGYVRDTHSIWFQTYAETGWIGLLLIIGLFALAAVAGIWRALRTADVEQRTALAAGVAGLAGFALFASVEWAWQMPVLPAVAIVFIATLLCGVADRPLTLARQVVADPPPRPWWQRGVAIAVSLGAIVAIAIPTAGVASLRASQAAVRDGDDTTALTKAKNAQSLQPYGATARLQEALVREQDGDIAGALAAIRAATEDEATNWKLWFVRLRIEARAGDAQGAVAAYRQARSLNPRSPLFPR